jgi:protein-S-isoprenylcysteine O-methyltransferase Ste14
MDLLQSSEAISYAWMVLVIFWFVSSWRVKRTEEAEAWGTRIPHIVTMVVAYLLLFDRTLRLGPLNQRFVAYNPRLVVAGVLLTWAGIAFAIWARVHIGQYWSARITLKEDHKLISTGPYAFVRHPIYTGLLTATVGTTLAIGRWQGLVGLAIILVAHILKARKEERLMTTHFGSSYEDYRRHTGFLIPRFR